MNPWIEQVERFALRSERFEACAVHAIICDTCKSGKSYLTEEVLARVEVLADIDPSTMSVLIGDGL